MEGSLYELLLRTCIFLYTKLKKDQIECRDESWAHELLGTLLSPCLPFAADKALAALWHFSFLLPSSPLGLGHPDIRPKPVHPCLLAWDLARSRR